MSLFGRTPSASQEGFAYEQLCARYLRTQGFFDIRMTKSSGDQGIDILARKGGVTYGFQCKHYAKPVSNRAVQEAYAGAMYYNCDRAVVISNNDFTKSAYALAEKLDVALWPNTELDGRGFRAVSGSSLAAVFILFLVIAAVLFAVLFQSRTQTPDSTAAPVSRNEPLRAEKARSGIDGRICISEVIP